ncbi:MAG: hypothetical protein IMY72_11305 [Bacteroidetes bacterium]|nr:hypothetical protein [Bacteroidota bacterium]
MKKLFFIIPIILLISCNQQKVEQLQVKNDSLAVASQQKDSLITDFVKSLNDISDNLDQIKEKEKIIALNTQRNVELNKNVKDKISDDVKSIYDMMIRNKNLIASLSKKLKTSNLKMKQFQIMIERLKKDLQQKDAEIKVLRNKLSGLNIEIDSLNLAIDTLFFQNTQKTKVIVEQKNELNTAYYVFGTDKELKEQKIISKKGGFVGIGGVRKLMHDFNKDYFTKIDISETKTIEIFMRKAKIITNHPSDSYKIYGEEKVDSLVIINSKKFWSVSKYLVIKVK